jgi:hypothetical protein
MEIGVRAFAGVETARSAMPAFRKALNSEYSLSPSLLKYAEEQTVVSLAAVLRAIRDFGLSEEKFTDWGAVAGPRFLGREAMTRHLDKVAIQGAPGTSPLITAYLSLHAISGTISQALQLHGPNLGVGGSRGNLEEALLIGLAMQQEQALPGVWVTASEWDPEPIPDDASQQPEPVCRALALALTQAGIAQPKLILRLVAGEDHRERASPTVADLMHFLLARGDAKAWNCPLAGYGCLELTLPAPAHVEGRSFRAA